MGAIALAVLSGAAGAATSKFLEKALDSGGKWFDEDLKDHQPQAIEKANTNVIAFLEILKRKIERLEADAGGIEERLNRIRAAMDEPDFAFCFKSALLQAARTGSNDKHAILARLVIERLANGGDSLLPIVVQQACECMGELTSNLLHTLALFTWFGSFNYADKEAAWGFAIDPGSEHLLRVARKLAPVSKLTRMDFLHLDTVSCVHITGGINPIMYDLNWLIVPSEEWTVQQRNSVLHLADSFRQDKDFTGSVTLTSKGLVIGVCAGDILMGETTDLKRVLR